MSEKRCLNCGRPESILPEHLSLRSCIANLHEDKEALARQLEEARRLLIELHSQSACCCHVEDDLTECEASKFLGLRSTEQPKTGAGEEGKS